MKIAIVGAGVAGSCVLRSLIEDAPLEEIEAIDVYEYREQTSKGLPYEEDDDSLWLNSSADRISCDPDRPHDFVDWLQEHEVDEEIIQGLVPRPYYGAYLHDRFLPYFNHPLVTVIKEKVVDFQAHDQEALAMQADGRSSFTYQLQTEGGEGWSDDYQAVFFAIGHPSYADYYHLDSYPSFIRQPYPANKMLSSLDDRRSIGIIGSGATSFDILRYLDKHYDFRQPLTLYVRTTPFTPTKVLLQGEPYQSSIDEAWIEAHRCQETYNIPLEEIYQQVLKDFEAYGVDWEFTCQQHAVGDLSENIRQYYSQPKEVGIVQEYFSYLTPLLPDLYQSLSQEDKEAYNQDQRPYVEHFRNVVPYPVMGMVLDWMKEDKLRIVSGLTDIQWNEETDGFDIYLDGIQHENTHTLINATGFDLRISEAVKRDPLLRNLYNKHYLSSDFESGEGVAVTWPETQLISPRYGFLPQVYFMGHFIFPTQYANNNAQLNMKQGRRSAEHLIRQLKK